ncbi:hypothetical protein B0A48_11225 [Cryoendolithus antarcticus]|uniref:RlpA-like protein double-psi beta-barrel domain-containing protein n=1 Tax=Cryoendolithus antarcticus TaxID=1507870 RepID=A0A1V8SVN1_9PEZI|nr:hypothetical protein B0A48_11225 [Cryoendolithus antarcticus]
MYTNTLALAGAFAVLVSAVPMAANEKRDIVWVTETAEAVVTVPVTTTVWVDGDASPTHYGHGHGGSRRTSTVLSTVIVQPSAPAPSAAAPSSVAEPAPSSESAPSSTKVPVAPVSSAEASSYVAPAPTTTSTAADVVATTPTSTYVAPTTTPTSTYVAPTTSAYVAPTTTSSAAPVSTSAASSGGSGLSSGLGASGTSYSGDLTYFAVGMGACGHVSSESDKMVAISHTIFDSYSTGNPNTNPLCGKSVTITGKDGSPYTAQIWDRCVGCVSADLDLPEAFFDIVTKDPTTGAVGDGRVHNMKWAFD